MRAYGKMNSSAGLNRAAVLKNFYKVPGTEISAQSKAAKPRCDVTERPKTEKPSTNGASSPKTKREWESTTHSKAMSISPMNNHEG